jgi:Zn-dependent peptidase ImmA (M78 family)
MIVHNDAHHPHRQASNISHEVSHCLLDHEPAPLLSVTGCRYWNDTFEAEADWLAGVLLVPRDGGLILMKRGWSVSTIAEHFGVSEHLCRWRLNQTGVMYQTRRLMLK